MPWPQTIPPDLRRRIDAVLSMRDSDANEVWSELRDWLMRHRVEAPDLPVEPPKETDWPAKPTLAI